jgi:PAS domain S-box-containing protein
VIPDTYQDARWQLLPGSEPIRSWIGAALLVKGRLIGVLNVDSHTVNAYDGAMAATVATFANHAAVAIERAQLYEQLQNQTARLAQEVQARTAELQMERDRTLSILESVGESIIVTDLDARILYVNPAMERQSGYGREEVVGQNPRILRSSHTPLTVYKKMWATIKGGNTWSGEIVNRRKDGTYYDLAVTIAPIKTPEGQITSFVSVQSDISHLKELDRLKSKFVSNVSHELRTPLTNIKLYLTLMARGKAERREGYLQVLHQEVDRLTKLIQDLLDLSRLEAAMQPDGQEQADLPQVLRELLKSARLKGEARGVEVQTAVATPLPQVRIAETHLQQLLSNLMENALLYTPQGGAVCVQVHTAVVNHHPMLQCTISDNGPGIAPQDLPYLFDRFYRGEAAREGSLPGTGLGLAICQEIINRYNGKIEVTSNPGQGATFTFWLPVTNE